MNLKTNINKTIKKNNKISANSLIINNINADIMDDKQKEIIKKLIKYFLEIKDKNKKNAYFIWLKP